MSKLRVATIGAGYFSRFHHDAWSRIDDASLVAVCDQDAAKAREYADRWSVPNVYTDVDAMLDTVRPDLVDIITPPHTHLELIRKTTGRKIPTVCQKAFCTGISEAEEAAKLAADAQTLLVVHENFRFQPWYREIRRQIEAGRVGTVYQAGFRMRPGDGQGPRAYLDRQPYFQKMERFLVHETAIHFVDTFRYLFGPVDAVMARLTRLNPVIAGEDAGFILFEFANGVRAMFDGNRLGDHLADDRRLTMGEMLVEGSEGTIRLDGYGRLFFRSFGTNVKSEIAYERNMEGFAGDSVLALQRHVVDHLLQGTPVVNTAADYLANLRIEAAIYASAGDGMLKTVRDDSFAEGAL
ncbi:Gfo/Idh/MocA family oxidoreductase [Aurantimonas sp. A2-1-M11]|uniref:Gfo/Idh/MocA family protein n=1 Tax=Aurantimonas sp. A2-1-M11 TaxID=3113712 RepID=UPI002F946E58